MKEESGIPKGIYLSIVCSEIIPQFDPGALPAATADTFLGGLRVGRDVSACREWGLDTSCLAKTEDLSFALKRDDLRK